MKIAALCVLLLGCQSSEKAPPAPAPQLSAASCRPFLVKARFVLQEMGSAAGMTYTQSIEEQAIKDCEADVRAGRPTELMACVLGAGTTDAIRHCFPTYDQVKAQGKPK